MDDFRKSTVFYILAGFTVTLGLAWNDAISSSITQYYPLKKDSLTAKFIYAIVLTVLVVLFARYIFKVDLSQNENPNQLPN